MCAVRLSERVGKGVEDSLIAEARDELEGVPVMPLYKTLHYKNLVFEGLEKTPIVKRVVLKWIEVHITTEKGPAPVLTSAGSE